MAYQAVDIGAAPNDGTGDPLRDAFDKINDNFVELYAGLAGLLDFKGSTDCSANPNYPAASKGDFYLVSVAGKIGGGSGISVQAGDTYFALADNAGGTQASVGSSWTVIQGNIVPTTVGGNLIGVTDPSAITFLRVNADNSVSLLSASAFRTAIGAGTGSGSGDMVAANNLSDVANAATAFANILQAAVASDINTGTNTSKALTADALAGSNLGIRYLVVPLNGSTALTTSDKAYVRIPAGYNGMNLVSVAASVGTGASGSSSSGTPTFTVKNVTDSNQMLSTSLTIDATEYTSATAATPAVIDTSKDDVVTDDLIEVACTTAGTGTTYATVTLGFQLP